ncbi:hypothetical protein [Staphylococcus capitis]|uniref:hypothetical protein n=1 Tax=Staphylococcus capitis TaxID=29388 RepID=UPI0011A866C4|nr:hypothetical protein [Staphylococcus capitis]
MGEGDKGFYRGWLDLGEEDGMLEKEEGEKIKMVCDDVNEVIYEAFKYVKIKEEKEEAYVESDLL